MTSPFLHALDLPEGIATTRDAFLGGLVTVEQPAKGFHRAGLDAVYLAAACPMAQRAMSWIWAQVLAPQASARPHALQTSASRWWR
ncbi:hypothetical protein V6L77_02685 [Pannonibacter sp. Pt2-lr]